MRYPGDNANPIDVARWMQVVAVNDYALPGALPVMASYVELTSAWTAPGDIKTLPGYLFPVDACSVGYFQQQADDLGCGTFGWGIRAQLVRADFALRRFCEEAVKYKGEYDANSADDLGAWCQRVQNSALPDAYARKGYPAAVQLLLKVTPVETPTQIVLSDAQGWTVTDTGLFVKGEPDATYKTDAKGWMYRDEAWVPEPEEKPDVCEWPDALIAPTWGDYFARHPTRYTWRADVEAWACWIAQNYDVSVNTYYDHPEGFWRTETSLDVWGAGGRGDFLPEGLGDQIWREIFWPEGWGPLVDWMIYQREIWTRASGIWTPWGSNAFEFHDDHIHVTWV